MILIFQSPTGNRKWKIAPHENGLCFKIYKTPIGLMGADGIVRNKDGKEVKCEWTDCRRYPTTMEHAIEMVVDLMLSDPEDDIALEFSGIDMRKGMERIFKKWLKEVKEGLVEPVDDN